MVYVIQVCWQVASRIRTELLASCQQTCMTYTIAVCTVRKTPDDGQRNCSKHVEFYSKNKFWQISASSWFYYKNLSRCTVTRTSKFKWYYYIHQYGCFLFHFISYYTWPMYLNFSLYLCVPFFCHSFLLTLIVLMWRIGWAHNNARKYRIGRWDVFGTVHPWYNYINNQLDATITVY